MKIRGYLMLLFGVLLLAGGYMGHIKAGSNMSLIAGMITGALAITCGIGLLLEKSIYLIPAQILSGFLTLFFLYRFFVTYSFMPAGLMVLVSAIVFSVLLKGPCKSCLKKD